MHEQSNIPTVRNLDGVYYRVVRDGNHVSRCFSDLSESEQDVIMEKYDAEQLRRQSRLSCSASYFSIITSCSDSDRSEKNRLT